MHSQHTGELAACAGFAAEKMMLRLRFRVAKRRGMIDMRELNQGRQRIEARRVLRLMLAVATVFALGSPGVRAFGELPDTLSLTAGSNAVLNFNLPGSVRLDAGSTLATLSQERGAVEIQAGEQSGSANLIFRLLGILPVKTVEVEVAQERTLIPGGKSVGIAIETEGLVVVGTSDLGQAASPAERAGLRAGDVIVAVNGVPVNDSRELAAQLRAGCAARLTVERDGREIEAELTPEADPRDGTLRIGAWVRNSTAGVGMLTYVDPETSQFGALGHAISDVDTGITLPVADGGLYENEIVQINRGRRGAPGEIVGDFLSAGEQIGEITGNGDCGIYGSDYCGNLDELPYPDGLAVGARSELHTGAAQILTTLEDDVQTFDCEIERVEPEGSADTRSIVLHITDPELISRTGGIVQGMSGSPILQDGKFVGAVTHVLVNDPTRGYGIYIGDMLKAAA